MDFTSGLIEKHNYKLPSQVVGFKFKREVVLEDYYRKLYIIEHLPKEVCESPRWLMFGTSWWGDEDGYSLAVLVTHADGKYHIITYLENAWELDTDVYDNYETVTYEQELIDHIIDILQHADAESFYNLIEFENELTEADKNRLVQEILDEKRKQEEALLNIPHMETDTAMAFFTEPVAERVTIDFTEYNGFFHLNAHPQELKRNNVSQDVLDATRWLEIRDDKLDISVAYVNNKFHILKLSRFGELTVRTASNIDEMYDTVSLLLWEQGQRVYDKYVTVL